MAISILLVRSLVGAVELAGIDRRPFLDGTRFDDATLADGSGRASVAEYDALVERALDLTRDAAFGLHMGETLSAAAHNLTGHLVANAATLRDGIDTLVRFHQLLSNRPAWTLCEAEDRATVSFAIGTGTPRVLRFRAETAMTGIYRLVRHFALSAQLERIAFQHPTPEHAAEYERIFGGVLEVAFGAEATGLSFDRALLSSSQLHHDPEFHAVLEAQATHRVSRLAVERPYADRVRDELLVRAGRDGRDMGAVARALGLSVRSLRRRLQAEGASFVDLANQTLAILAKRLLERQGAAIEQAAYELGFSDPSAFHRAFKRWTGTTPNEFRRARSP